MFKSVCSDILSSTHQRGPLPEVNDPTAHFKTATVKSEDRGPAPAQVVIANWSCSIGFFTQAPSPAFWKALKSVCLEPWYSSTACLASW